MRLFSPLAKRDLFKSQNFAQVSRNPTSFVFLDRQSRKFVKVTTGLTNFVSTFLPKKKVSKPECISSQANVLWLFLFAQVSEKLPQPGYISKRLMYSGFFYLPPFKMIFNMKERKQKRIANSTQCSQAVTHPSTNRAQHCLTSVIGRELVCSM